MPKARAAAERALAIDSNLGLAEVVLGEVAQFFDYDLTAAARHSERAIALDPNNHYVHQGLGFLHAARGQFGPAVQAVQAVKQACAIDPLNRTVYGYGAIVHMAARTPEEAVRLADQAVDLDPHYWDSLRLAGWAHLFLGDRPGAVSRLDRALVLSQPHPFVTLMHEPRSVAKRPARPLPT